MIVDPPFRDAVFVLGAPRSGTTFLGRLVGALPGFGYCHEPLLPKCLVGAVYRGTIGPRAARTVFTLAYAAHLAARGQLGRRLVEKTPRNCAIADFLAESFERSRFVHIVRDGRDAATSHLREPWLADGVHARSPWHPHRYVYGPHPRFWVEPQRREQFRHASHLRRIAWEWRRYNDFALALADALAPERYLFVRYEQFARGASETVDRLREFLGVPAAAGSAAGPDRVTTFRADSIGRGARSLLPAQVREYEDEAGDMLRRLGYELWSEGSAERRVDARG